jgi:hypothetical protein
LIFKYYIYKTCIRTIGSHYLRAGSRTFSRALARTPACAPPPRQKCQFAVSWTFPRRRPSPTSQPTRARANINTAQGRETAHAGRVEKLPTRAGSRNCPRAIERTPACAPPPRQKCQFAVSWTLPRRRSSPTSQPTSAKAEKLPTRDRTDAGMRTAPPTEMPVRPVLERRRRGPS